MEIVASEELLKETAMYRTMEGASARDFGIIEANEAQYAATEADRILDLLKRLKGWTQGLHIDVFEHSLQTATRALRDGREEDYVVCCLLHDIGDTLSVHNHADLAAAILRPFVSEDLHWMVQHHAIFQLHHKSALPERVRNQREVFQGHSCFDLTAEFCALYDQVSFDDRYKSLPLEEFEPMVRRVFSTPWGKPAQFDAIELETGRKIVSTETQNPKTDR